MQTLQSPESCLVYSTAPNLELAEKWCSELLQLNLIACANIIPGMVSLYRWQGNLQRDSEVVVILKTVPSRLKELQKKYLELHSYETPCFLVLPAEGGNPAYLDWITKETQNESK